MRHRYVSVAVAAVSAVVLLGACSGGSHRAASSPSPSPSRTRPSHTTTPTHKATHHPARHRKKKRTPQPHKLTVDPLSGRKPVPQGPVIGVKIDDTANGRPQQNVDAADVVYVEQVEGGLTRLLALYAGARPGIVGPVRSARFNDTELLAQYGKVGLAYSGAAAAVVDTVNRSPLVGASAPQDPGYYVRAGTHPAPYNMYLHLHDMAAHLHAAGVKQMGFRWAPNFPRFRRRVHSFATRVGQTPIEFVWHTGLHQWVRRIGGVPEMQSDGAAVSTPNVIIQSCLVHKDPRDVDVAGNASYYTTTIGSGRALVFSGGKVIDGKWSRRSATGPTYYRDQHGRNIDLHPGGVWILLVARGAPVTMH